MKLNRTQSNKGFSLVELLAVVLILAVLAAVAVPLYLNTRKTSAARACKGNLAAIATAESTYALRKGGYVAMGDLVTASPEGLSAAVLCPLNNAPYDITDGAGPVVAGTPSLGPITIECPNKGDHFTDMGSDVTNSPATSWTRTMSAIGTAEGAP